MFHIWRGLEYINLPAVIMENTRRIGISKNKFGGQRHVFTVGIDLPMYEVSTTRGTPSKSTNLKEALCEKIPIHYDVLRNFRQQHGSSVISHITVENMYQGLNGLNTMVRETSETDPNCGIKYRGLTISEVINLLPRQGKSPSAEAVFWLLLTGDIPTHEQTASLITDWTIRRQRKKDWWSGLGGGILSSVLQSLPNTVTPLGKLSIALTVFDSSKHMKEASKNGAFSHTHWEYVYEDGMEFLAILPAIVGLIANGKELKNVKEEGDWVEFLFECLGSSSVISENHKNSIVDFLRLYVTLNADEDGGVPAVHVTEILGASQIDINHALAAGVLAYSDESMGNAMSQYIEFQANIQSALGLQPKEEKLKNYIATLSGKDKLIGYKETKICDPRYTALLNYVKEHVPYDHAVKLSQDITRIITTMLKTTRGKNIYPEQSTIAAPVFQFYGLKNMKFNEVLLCMSRALGAVASIIWAKAIHAPVEHPASKCTYTYLTSVQEIRKRNKHNRPHIKHSRK